MITIDPALLSTLGINLSDQERQSFVEHIQATLEERVGLNIMEILDDDEAIELIGLTEQGNEQTITNWLASHVPEYKDIVRDEFDILMGEVAEHAAAV